MAVAAKGQPGQGRDAWPTRSMRAGAYGSAPRTRLPGGPGTARRAARRGTRARANRPGGVPP